MQKEVAVIWLKAGAQGSITTANGSLLSKSEFSLGNKYRLEFQAEGNCNKLTHGTTMITINNYENPFTFNLSDVTSQYPIYIPAYGVAVIPREDTRTYNEVENCVRARGLKKHLDEIEDEPEASYENAAKHTRDLKCVTWLGLSRDVRIFWVGFRGDRSGTMQLWDFVTPKYHFSPLEEPGFKGEITYSIMCGRGIGCQENVNRWLEDGWMPILKGEIMDDHVRYEVTTFTVPERSAYTAETLRGTDSIVADGYTACHIFTKEQNDVFESMKARELQGDEQVMLYYRTVAVNTGSTPDYAHFRVPMPNVTLDLQDSNAKQVYSFSDGLGIFSNSRVFCIASINGKRLSEEEFSVPLLPGEKVIVDYIIPHSPLSEERAREQAENPFDKRYKECKAFWKNKIDTGASIHLPEKRVNEMLKAGICHIDIAAYGRELDGSVIPTVGVYSAIGSESAPHILFMDSMGYHDVACRMLQYFLDKQHEDGFIHNYEGYELETGPILWCAGEHYRITRDEKWAISVADNLIRGSDYIIRWRNQNKADKFVGCGYGLIDGRVADPSERMHSFMLNGYAYLGIVRSSEILKCIGHPDAKHLAAEAEDYKKDIRNAFFDSIRKSPVLPLDDGSWCPSCAPWPESIGPMFFHFEGGNWLSHGTLSLRDSITGPLWLAFTEVLNCTEMVTGFLMDYHTKYMTQRNVGFSQPYYCRHDYIHLMRGEVKAFLKTYYNGFAGLGDRETYTFWEHYFHYSPHKTHEECWFLMQTRWMLYLEDGNILKIFPGIPRKWLAEENGISVRNVASHFGHLSFNAYMTCNGNTLVAEVSCELGRLPDSVNIRLPHPKGLKAVYCEGGEYSLDTEIVVINNFDGKAYVVLKF